MSKVSLLISFLFIFSFISCSFHNKTNKNYDEKQKENWNEIEAEVLLKTSKSWDGKHIEYPDGKPEITILKILIPEGTRINKHCHPVPSFGYMVKGILEVEISETKKKNLLKTGDTIPEVINTWHFGRAIEDTEIIVLYTGNTELSISLRPDSDPSLINKCQ